MPTQFLFNISNQYKIWFSANRDLFLPMTNQLRLIRMRKNNPNVTIHFVYSERYLSPSALANLNTFCLRYNIVPVELDTIFDGITSNTDKQLASLVYKELELYHSNQGGNLGAASDYARLIQKLIEHCGIYSDFDVHSSLEKLFTSKLQKHLVFSLPGPI